jgi:hypothetical protein
MYKSLYDTIEHIVDLAIPLWNDVLTPLAARDSNQRIPYSTVEYDPDPETIPKEKRPQRFPDEIDTDFWERYDRWERDTRRVVRPEPEKFRVVPDTTKRVNLKGDFAKRGIQVIVKLANIHLTPEKPEYQGGTWHIEGQMVSAHFIHIEGLYICSG